MLVGAATDDENSGACLTIVLERLVAANSAITREAHHVGQEQFTVFGTVFASFNKAVSNLECQQLSVIKLLTAVELLCTEIGHSLARGEWPVSVVHGSTFVVANGLSVVLKKSFEVI